MSSCVSFKRSTLVLVALLCTQAQAACGDAAEEKEQKVQESVQCDGAVCDVVGNLVEDVTFTEDKTYILRTGVFVGDDATDAKATLTIEPGTVIKGDTSSLTFLSVSRGSKIQAAGTKEKPIVFTSNAPEGSRAPGDWGGLIINGSAPSNKCEDLTNCDAEGEGGGGLYGGDDPEDNSGKLSYVRVEFAGKQITDDNELNGIAFQGVGSGTVVEHLHIHRSKDDVLEFFGGNVNIKHVLMTCIGDDGLDWTDGWTGNGQFIASRQCEGDGGNGVEADSSKNDALVPRSHPTLSNMTIVGPDAGNKSGYGMLLRRGTAASIHNTLVLGFKETCIGVDDESTFSQLGTGLTFKNTHLHCPGSVLFCDATKLAQEQLCTADGLDHMRVETFFTDETTNKTSMDPELMSPYASNLSDLSLVPSASSPLAGQGSKPSDAFFEDVDYIGAFAPGGSNWADWTAFPKD